MYTLARTVHIHARCKLKLGRSWRRQRANARRHSSGCHFDRQLVDKHAHFESDSFLKGEWPEKPLSERACSRQDVFFVGL